PAAADRDRARPPFADTAPPCRRAAAAHAAGSTPRQRQNTGSTLAISPAAQSTAARAADAWRWSCRPQRHSRLRAPGQVAQGGGRGVEQVAQQVVLAGLADRA